MASATETRLAEKQFQLIAAHPALDLVNTLDWRFRARPEELLSTYGDVLRFLTQSAMLSPADAENLARLTTPRQGEALCLRCTALREATARVLYAVADERAPDASSVDQLEKFFQDARKRQDLEWTGSRLQWKMAPGPPTADLPLWLLARSVEELLLSDDMQRLRACENHECRWLFLDTSKNHTRRWCDMKLCGNRMKARRFKAQHKH